MTVPHYGKREPGLLTAASPGDTLYFNFASYNDSGNSEALTGLATTDIEVIKNGSATVRATDSGYSLISDTGMVGDRAGLYRFSVQLFNTADDATFYASGGWYQVFVDSVAIDGQTVRAWCGSFEIGRNKVNAVEIDSDTGASSVLRQFAATNGTLSPTGELDTGSVANGSAIAADTKRLAGDTGAANWLKSTYLNGFSDTGIQERLGRIQSDVDTGLRVHIDDLDTGLHAHISDVDTGLHAILALQDTGAMATAVWAGDTGIRAMLLLQDTGKVATAVWAQDTGLRDLITDSKNELDTGIKAVLALADTGKIATAVWAGDTGLRDHITNVDTGLTNRLNTIAFDVDTGLRDTIADLDTGIRDYIDNTDTGLRGVITHNDTGTSAKLDAIKTKTDGLTFTKAGEVDANIQSVNDVTVSGTGASGSEWGP